MLGISVHDATGGYRAYRAKTLQGVSLETVDSQGYCFQIDLTVRTVNNGGQVAEVPITFTERAKGASKMSRSIILEALWRVAQWGVAARLGGKRRGARQ
jgi:dolichol-phosphate mannosyltransferase